MWKIAVEYFVYILTVKINTNIINSQIKFLTKGPWVIAQSE